MLLQSPKNNTGLHATTQNNSKVSTHKAKPNCRTSNTVHNWQGNEWHTHRIFLRSNTQFTVDKEMIWHTHRIFLRKVHRLTDVLCAQSENSHHERSSLRYIPAVKWRTWWAGDSNNFCRAVEHFLCLESYSNPDIRTRPHPLGICQAAQYPTECEAVKFKLSVTHLRHVIHATICWKEKIKCCQTILNRYCNFRGVKI